MFGSLNKINNIVIPKRPSPTTLKLITEPAEKEISNPLEILFLTASAVLTFARVAIRIPILPASIENIEPAKKLIALLIPRPGANHKIKDTSTTKIERILYSLFKKA